MGKQENTAEVTAIVAALNEGPRIGSVLDTLMTYPGFAEVVVVDDGSVDDTAAVSETHGARVIRLPSNQGKGHAMDVGVEAARTEVLFFADADIHGLTHQAIAQVVGPVARGQAEMFVAMRKRTIYYLRFIMTFIPLLGGERALTRALWEAVPERYKARFQIEAALNFYAVHYGKGLRFRVFNEISQTAKERKFGFKDGIKRRLRMSLDVAQAMWELQFHDPPPDFRVQRAATAALISSIVGFLLGAFLMLAAVIGPASFIGTLFAEELAEDPRAPFVHALLLIGSALGAGVLTALGLLLVLGNGAYLYFALVRLPLSRDKRARG